MMPRPFVAVAGVFRDSFKLGFIVCSRSDFAASYVPPIRGGHLVFSGGLP